MHGRRNNPAGRPVWAGGCVANTDATMTVGSMSVDSKDPVCQQTDDGQSEPQDQSGNVASNADIIRGRYHMKKGCNDHELTCLSKVK
jgi:hypothetical protein